MEQSLPMFPEVGQWRSKRTNPWNPFRFHSGSWFSSFLWENGSGSESNFKKIFWKNNFRKYVRFWSFKKTIFIINTIWSAGRCPWNLKKGKINFELKKKFQPMSPSGYLAIADIYKGAKSKLFIKIVFSKN